MLTPIDLSTIDANLLNDIRDETAGLLAAAGWALYEGEYEAATVANQGYQILFNAEAGRGGVVFVGSGSSGLTSWTDAATPDEVLARYLADDMRA